MHVMIELVSTSESDAQSFCTPGSSSSDCQKVMPDGFITASAFQKAEDDSWIQVWRAPLLLPVDDPDLSLLYRSLAVSTRASQAWIRTIPADS